MSLNTDNVFFRLEQEVRKESAVQLACVLIASNTRVHALDMLAGVCSDLTDQRKRLLVWLANVRHLRKGSDDKREPHALLQAQAYDYLRHSL